LLNKGEAVEGDRPSPQPVADRQPLLASSFKAKNGSNPTLTPYTQLAANRFDAIEW